MARRISSSVSLSASPAPRDVSRRSTGTPQVVQVEESSSTGKFLLRIQVPRTSKQWARWQSYLKEPSTDPSASQYSRFFGIENGNSVDTLPNEADQNLFLKALECAQARKRDEWRIIRAELEDDSSPPTKTRGIKYVQIGKHRISSWYSAPYPDEITMNSIVYVCDRCLKYMESNFILKRHNSKCSVMAPPGVEIYRKEEISIFEVDGKKNSIYCQNLCLLAKMFIQSKSLCYDVDPFLFYVMTIWENGRNRFVGYFSKEKLKTNTNNVSCILLLPTFQRMGYSHFLIDFSYLLSKFEKKLGSPEKPISDLGLLSYRSYWRITIARLLLSKYDAVQSLSLQSIANETAMTIDDIVSTLESMDVLEQTDDSENELYSLVLNQSELQKILDRKRYIRADPDYLSWIPITE